MVEVDQIDGFTGDAVAQHVEILAVIKRVRHVSPARESPPFFILEMIEIGSSCPVLRSASTWMAGSDPRIKSGDGHDGIGLGALFGPLVEGAVLHDHREVGAVAVEQRDVGERVAGERDQIGAGAGRDDAEFALAVE